MNTFLTVTLENTVINDLWLRAMAASLVKLADNYYRFLDGGNLYWRKYEPADRPQSQWSKSTDPCGGMQFTIRNGSLIISVPTSTGSYKLKGIRMAVDAYLVFGELSGTVAYGRAWAAKNGRTVELPKELRKNTIKAARALKVTT